MTPGRRPLTSDGVVELGLGEDVLLDELERSGPVRQPLAQAVLQARPLQQPLLLLDRRVGRRVLQDVVLHQRRALRPLLKLVTQRVADLRHNTSHTSSTPPPTGVQHRHVRTSGGTVTQPVTLRYNWYRQTINRQSPTWWTEFETAKCGANSSTATRTGSIEPVALIIF